MNLRGTPVLITGGSRGLGASLGKELAGRGARVVLVARDGAALRAAADAIAAGGGEAHALVADVADKDQTYAVAGAAAALVGPIAILIHNASALGPTPLRELLDTACEDLERVLAANLVGPFRLTKAIAGPMRLRGEGLVVAVSSDAAVQAYPGWGAYGVSKAALDHLMRVWAAELGDTGVRFASVDPGEMDTRMHAEAMPDADRSALRRPEDVARRLADAIEADALGAGARVELAEAS